MTEILLDVENLKVSFRQQCVVDGVSFQLGRERVGLVGESGSGKSMTARALMGLIRRPGRVSAERLLYYPQARQHQPQQPPLELLTLKPTQWAALRGNEIALVLQDPRYALNPVLTVGQQISEALTLHQQMSHADCREQVTDALAAVGLSAAVYHSYSGQLSGGMGQRVMLAMALINNPQVLIADEPTSALDARLRQQILELMVEQTQQRNMGLLLISHDLPSVAQHCDRVLVMYQGKLVDSLLAADLPQAQHPYTGTLWACRPGASTYGTLLPVLDRHAANAYFSPGSGEDDGLN